MITPDELIENFSFLEDWEDKYRYLIELGDILPQMSSNEKIPENKVDGCMSQVWISHKEENGHHFFAMDSDAHIVRGLEAILFILINGKSSSEIHAVFDKNIFDTLGLNEHLSPTRRNGFFGMIQRIKSFIS